MNIASIQAKLLAPLNLALVLLTRIFENWVNARQCCGCSCSFILIIFITPFFFLSVAWFIILLFTNSTDYWDGCMKFNLYVDWRIWRFWNWLLAVSCTGMVAWNLSFMLFGESGGLGTVCLLYPVLQQMLGNPTPGEAACLKQWLHVYICLLGSLITHCR